MASKAGPAALTTFTSVEIVHLQTAQMMFQYKVRICIEEIRVCCLQT